MIDQFEHFRLKLVCVLFKYGKEHSKNTNKKRQNYFRTVWEVVDEVKVIEFSADAFRLYIPIVTLILKTMR